MNQKKKKQATPAPAPEPLLDILASPKNRRLFFQAAGVVYTLGFALSVWGNLHSGASLAQALGRTLVMLLVVLVLQSPVLFWYRKRMKSNQTTQS
jgi:hypothetical protein